MTPEFATLLAGIGGGILGGCVGAGATFFFNHRWSLFRDARKAHFDYLALIRRTQSECDSLTSSLQIIKSESLDNLHIPVKRLPLAVLTTARLAPATTPKSQEFHKLLSPVEVDLNLFNQLLELYRANNPNGSLTQPQQQQLNATVTGVNASLKALRDECQNQITVLEGNEPKLSCFMPPCDCV